MSTKTMRLPPRRVSMQNDAVKRKEREDFDAKHFNRQPPAKSPKLAVPSLAASEKAAHPVLPNQLLAGYLAYEFLTRETLFGQPWDPTRPQQTVTESRMGNSEYAEPSERSKADEVEPKPKPREDDHHQRYVEVANLLKTDGARIPGIVNPSQLARFLQL